MYASNQKENNTTSSFQSFLFSTEESPKVRNTPRLLYWQLNIYFETTYTFSASRCLGKSETSQKLVSLSLFPG